jgi:hypothetical protein
LTGDVWHIPMYGHPAEISTDIVCEESFSLPVTLLKLERLSSPYPVIGIRTGLEGRVIALHSMKGGIHCVFYTDILTESGKKSKEAGSNFLDNYAQGRKPRD